MADMNDGNEDHIPDQALEEYSRGALSEEEAGHLEEHLLICPHCQDRLADTDEFVRAMRDATARLQMELPSPLEDRWRDAWRWLWRPVPVMTACGAAVLLIATGTIWNRGRPGAYETTVMLQTTRGDALAAAHAPAGRALLLKLDAKGLPALASYRLEIVDADGSAVLQRAVDRQPDAIAAPLPQRLNPGTYWVRLYEPQAAGTLLREFGLTIDLPR
jgi:anti-sigma factor RsiW